MVSQIAARVKWGTPGSRKVQNGAAKGSKMRHTLFIAISVVVSLAHLPAAWAQSSARIYVYVQSEAAASSWFPISCDGTVVAKIKRGRLFAVNVAPGRHILSDEKGVPVVVDARKGEESFVHIDWRYEVGGPTISVLQTATPAEAQSEMIHLRYIDAGEVFSKAVPKTDPRKPPRLMRRRETDDK
jgi:hypothetical protein